MADESDARPAMTPEQLQWVLDHNAQIRAGHRVQIADAVQAWQADRAALSGGPVLECSECGTALRPSEVGSDWYFDCGCEPPRVRLSAKRTDG